MSLEEKAMWWIAIFAMLAFVPASASAEEPAVDLKQAPGVDIVEAVAPPVTASIRLSSIHRF
jgi:hypothetical protein